MKLKQPIPAAWEKLDEVELLCQILRAADRGDERALRWCLVRAETIASVLLLVRKRRALAEVEATEGAPQ